MSDDPRLEKHISDSIKNSDSLRSRLSRRMRYLYFYLYIFLARKQHYLSEIKEVVAEICDIDAAEIDSVESNFYTDLSMDSLGSVTLLVDIERKYGVRIEETKLANMLNILETVWMILQYEGRRAA